MCNILLVEADHKLRASLANLLDEGGYTVFSSGTIQEARIILSHNLIELAIVGLNLPNGEGLEIVETIYTQVPILILGQDASPEIKNELAVYGIKAFLEKPFNEELFITIVDKTISKRESAETFIERSEKQDSNKQVGEDINLERVYAKIATISSRVNLSLDEMASLKKDLREQCDKVNVVYNTLDALLDRTEDCERRGVAIALLEQRADFMDRDVKEAKSQAKEVGNYFKEHPGAIGTILNTGGILLFLIGKSQGWW